MKSFEDALALAATRHKGQVDKAGKPYILHLLRVAMQMGTELEMTVAILHDVVEGSTASPWPATNAATNRRSNRMQRAIFDYPKEFTTLPDYTAHAGQEVEIVRPLTAEEADDGPDMERMFLIRASDGWEGHAFESELLDRAQSIGGPPYDAATATGMYDRD